MRVHVLPHTVEPLPGRAQRALHVLGVSRRPQAARPRRPRRLQAIRRRPVSSMVRPVTAYVSVAPCASSGSGLRVRVASDLPEVVEAGLAGL